MMNASILDGSKSPSPPLPPLYRYEPLKVYSFRTARSHLLWNLIEGLFINFHPSSFRENADMRGAARGGARPKSLFMKCAATGKSIKFRNDEINKLDDQVSFDSQ